MREQIQVLRDGPPLKPTREFFAGQYRHREGGTSLFPKHLKLVFSALQLLICLAWVAHALAGQVTLAWDATTIYADGTPVTDLAGYHLYYWQDSTGTPQSVPVGNTTTYTLTGLVDGTTYSFAVAAYNTSGNESSNSNTITVTLPSVNPAP